VRCPGFNRREPSRFQPALTCAPSEEVRYYENPLRRMWSLHQEARGYPWFHFRSPCQDETPSRPSSREGPAAPRASPSSPLRSTCTCASRTRSREVFVNPEWEQFQAAGAGLGAPQHPPALGPMTRAGRMGDAQSRARQRLQFPPSLEVHAATSTGMGALASCAAVLPRIALLAPRPRRPTTRS
jgi:hypothetical protein